MSGPAHDVFLLSFKMISLHCTLTTISPVHSVGPGSAAATNDSNVHFQSLISRASQLRIAHLNTQSMVLASYK